MMRAITALIIILIASSCTTTSVQSYNQKPNAKVIVTGVGSDLKAAKSAAIRSAMAIRTDQTIVSEQLLLNDDIKTDLLASSMLGELSFFKVLNQTIDENGFTKIVAEVGISRKELRQKKSAYKANNGNRFNSNEISNKLSSAQALKEAKKLHEKSQLENAKSLTSNLLAGFSRATQAQVEEIKIDPENPQSIVLELSYGLKKEWTKNLKKQLKLIESFWSNKNGMWDQNSRYQEHIIKMCQISAFGGCTHLPAKPKSHHWSISNNSDIRIFIPVFSSAGNYMTCLKTKKDKVKKLLWVETPRGYSWVYASGYSGFYYVSSSRSYNLKVPTRKLYSSTVKAEFFYPFIVLHNSENSGSSMCEMEGRKMHAASGNKLFTGSASLISKASASNKPQERSRDKAYAPMSSNGTRKKYFSSPGSKIKIIQY